MDNNKDAQIKCRSCGKISVSSQMRLSVNGKDMICPECTKKEHNRDVNLKNVARL